MDAERGSITLKWTPRPAPVRYPDLAPQCSTVCPWFRAGKEKTCGHKEGVEDDDTCHPAVMLDALTAIGLRRARDSWRKRTEEYRRQIEEAEIVCNELLADANDDLQTRLATAESALTQALGELREAREQLEKHRRSDLCFGCFDHLRDKCMLDECKYDAMSIDDAEKAQAEQREHMFDAVRDSGKAGSHEG